MVGRLDTVIIGSGITGITCARLLHDAGVSVRVVDKGRGIGGRIATRRAIVCGHEIGFDHGAQYFSPHDLAFLKFLVTAGAVNWNEHDERERLVGTSSMSAIPRMLAQGLPISQQVEVKRLSWEDSYWLFESADERFSAERLILTVPAPQALQLLGDADLLTSDLQTVEMSPCLTLMAAFPKGDMKPFNSRLDLGHPLAWIAQDSSKPDRTMELITWVAQAGPEFSADHIECSPDTITTMMLPLLCEIIGALPKGALYAQAHRWRYAQAVRPVGRRFLNDITRNLWVGGDWCLGSRAEDGWFSGEAIAQSILDAEHAH